METDFPSDNEYNEARDFLDVKFGKKSERETVSKPSKKSYKKSPQLKDGKATSSQIGDEYSTIIYEILRAYGVKHQLARFIFTLYSLGKDGKEFEICDDELATIHGGTRNYISARRKDLKEWINGEYEGGIKHHPFIAYKDNTYDHNLKCYLSTQYTVSEDFINLVNEVWDRVYELPQYNYDWRKAVQMAIKAAGKSRLNSMGKMWQRPPRSERSPEKIVGTLFVSLQRIISKIFNINRAFGFDIDKTEIIVLQLIPEFIKQAREKAIIEDSVNPIKPNEKDIIEFFNLAIDYVNAKELENNPESDSLLSHIFKLKKSLMESEENVCSNVEQPVISSQVGRESGSPDRKTFVAEMVESGEALRADEGTPNKSAFHSQRQRFYARDKKRE